MASAKDKYLESAQKFILKGQLDRAIKDYQQVVSLDPKETRHRQKLAELMVRAGRNDEAVGEYEVIGKYYADNGYYLKAIAVYKQIQKLTPDNIKITLTLASLNGKQGLTGNALDEYRTVVDYYEKNHKLNEAVKTIEKMLELDAENPATLQKYAEVLICQVEREKAFDVYAQLAKILKARGNQPGLEKINARMSTLFPDRLELSLEDLASLVKSDVENAIGKLSALIKKDNGKLDLWKLLVEAYKLKGDDEKLRLTFDLIIRMFPGELFAREGIIGCALKAHNIVEGIEQLGKHADIFLEQGSFHNLEMLYLAFQQQSDDQRVVDGLRQLYQASGESEKLASLEKSLPVIDALEDLDEIPEAEDASAGFLESIESTAHALHTQVVESAEKQDYLYNGAEDDWEDEVYISDEDEDDLSAELSISGEETLSLDEETSLDGEALSLEEEASLEEASLEEASLEEASLEEASLEEASLEEDALLDEPCYAEEEALTTEDILCDIEIGSDLDYYLADEEMSTGEIVLDESTEEPEIELAIEGNALDLEDENENSLALELAEDETEVMTPENGTVHLLELEEDDVQEYGPLLLELEETEDSTELSLTEEVNSLLAGDDETFDFDISKGMDQLFDKFDDFLTLEEETAAEGKAVKYSWDGMFTGTDEQAALGDAETHFDLGIAYKEMGLFDDAITEFSHASVSPSRKLDSISLQAACYREKGDNELAEKLLLDGVSLEATDEDLLGLKYELALLYETSGRQDEAFSLYLEISGINPEFHGVEEKILSLQGDHSLEMVDLELEELH